MFRSTILPKADAPVHWSLRRRLLRRRTKPGRTVWTAIGWWILGFVLVPVSAHVAVESLGLRFCQPFRCEHMAKVFYFQQQKQRFDIVFLGTSQVHYGVMPGVVVDSLEQQGWDGVTAFNLAVPGSELEISWILARDVLRRDHRPRLVVLGVFPGILSANDIGQPQLVARYGKFSDVAARVRAGELPPTELVGTAFRDVGCLLQWPVRRFKRPIRAYRADHLALGNGGWWLPQDIATAEPVPSNRWRNMLQHLGSRKELYYADSSRPAALLRNFADLARTRGFRLIVVSLPQHPDVFRRLYVNGSRERCRRWLTRFVRRQGVEYYDLAEPSRYGHDDFADPMHLNARGAAQFSRRLAAVLIAHSSRQSDSFDPTDQTFQIGRLRTGD